MKTLPLHRIVGNEASMTNDNFYAALVALKEATEAGFRSLERRCEQMDHRFDAIDARLDRLETHVIRLETRIEALEIRLNCDRKAAYRLGVAAHQPPQLAVLRCTCERGRRSRYSVLRARTSGRGILQADTVKPYRKGQTTMAIGLKMPLPIENDDELLRVSRDNPGYRFKRGKTAPRS